MMSTRELAKRLFAIRHPGSAWQKDTFFSWCYWDKVADEAKRLLIEPEKPAPPVNIRDLAKTLYESRHAYSNWSLENEATRKGWECVARKALEVLGNPPANALAEMSTDALGKMLYSIRYPENEEFWKTTSYKPNWLAMADKLKRLIKHGVSEPESSDPAPSPGESSEPSTEAVNALREATRLTESNPPQSPLAAMSREELARTLYSWRHREDLWDGSAYQDVWLDMADKAKQLAAGSPDPAQTEPAVAPPPVEPKPVEPDCGTVSMSLCVRGATMRLSVTGANSSDAGEILARAVSSIIEAGKTI